ncbi:MAG: choice-of-anchor Q domain-containing protein, partial [Planctomycetota bacterium]
AGSHGVLWDAPDNLTDIGPVSCAKSINDKGQVTGKSRLTGLYNAYLWDREHGMIRLGTLGGYTSEGYDINNNGQVVGRSYVNEGNHAFLWEDLNQNGQSEPGEMRDLGTLEGGQWSEAFSINNIGQAVGGAHFGGHYSNFYAFIWDKQNGMVSLGAINGTRSWARAINDAGQVVGVLATGSFIWDKTNGMINLADFVPNSGWGELAAFDINNRGHIVGYGRTSSGAKHAFLMTPVPPKIIYVDGDATGNNDGSSWADAYNYLQDALADANLGDEIWVAEGIYKPDQGIGITPADREATFHLINGVSLKGGYAGADTPDPNVRDVELYETILAGDLNGDDAAVDHPEDLLEEPTRAENSYHVVTGSGTDETAVLDGFTITAGNADGSYPNNCGGGMYNYRGSPTVANCTLRGNAARSDGGGVLNCGTTSYKVTPRLTNCTFKRNSSARCGGGMCNWDSNATLTTCTFIGNSTADDGGGIYISNDSKLALTNCAFRGNLAGRSGGGIVGGDSTLTNCTFDRNLAGRFGGGIYVIGRPTLTDCTFSGNSAAFGGGVASYFGPTLTNCRITGNAAVYYGGGLASFGYGSPTLTNCTFAGNSAPNGTALACDSLPDEPHSQLVLTNSILWDSGREIWNGDDSTITITYSDIEGGWPGFGNIDADPCFVELGYWDANGVWIDGDYHLLVGSPCIDAGDPNFIAEQNETDLDGRPRVIGGRIDMGAYESPVPAEVRIVPRSINLESKGNWITCYIWLPENYNVADIEPNSVFLEDEFQTESLKVDEEQQVAMARFSRSEVQGILNAGDTELTITGQLTDGTVFEGTDVIRVINKAGKK